MKNNKRYIIIVVIILIFLITNIDLKSIKAQLAYLENDLYKIVPDSKTGMINIYIKKFNSYSLFYSIPSSSKILIKYDNFQYLLESTGSVIQDFTVENNSLTFKWGTKFLSLTQTINFIKLDDLNVGVEVKIEVTNLDVKGHFVGIGILFDTYFGENYNKPFQISNLGIIDTEQYFKKSSIPMSIYSLDNPNNPVVGLIFYPKKTGMTIPDKIIIANYDELLNNFWNFSFMKGRSFSSTYKRLDAAVGYVFDESFINNNQAKSVSFVLGFYPIKTAESKEDSQATEVKEQTSDKIYPQDIDSKMSELKSYLEQQIKSLNEKIEELKKKYETIKSMDSNFFAGSDLLKACMDLLTEINALESQIHQLNDEEFNEIYMDLLNKLEELIALLNELMQQTS